MLVPEGDIVCRFVRIGDWSVQENRPKASAFKQNNGLSVWHGDRLREEYNASLEDLCIGSFVGSGQAHYKVSDYHDCAAIALEQEEGPCSVEVKWRPEPEYVPVQWQQWKEAHAQVEIEASREAELEWRRQLTLRAVSRDVIPPVLE